MPMFHMNKFCPANLSFEDIREIKKVFSMVFGQPTFAPAEAKPSLSLCGLEMGDGLMDRI